MCWSCVGHVMLMWLLQLLAVYRWCAEAVHSHDGHLPPVYRQPLSCTWGKYVPKGGAGWLYWSIRVTRSWLSSCKKWKKPRWSVCLHPVINAVCTQQPTLMGAPYTNWHICAYVLWKQAHVNDWLVPLYFFLLLPSHHFFILSPPHSLTPSPPHLTSRI